jgi:hypothetical protein
MGCIASELAKALAIFFNSVCLGYGYGICFSMLGFFCWYCIFNDEESQWHCRGVGFFVFCDFVVFVFVVMILKSEGE